MCLQSGLSGSWRGRFAGFSHKGGLKFYYQAPEVPFLGVRRRQLWKERGIGRPAWKAVTLSILGSFVHLAMFLNYWHS